MNLFIISTLPCYEHSNLNVFRRCCLAQKGRGLREPPPLNMQPEAAISAYVLRRDALHTSDDHLVTCNAIKAMPHLGRNLIKGSHGYCSSSFERTLPLSQLGIVSESKGRKIVSCGTIPASPELYFALNVSSSRCQNLNES